MDPDPDSDPAIFASDRKDGNEKIIKKKFLCLLLFKIHLHHFSKIEEVTKRQKSRFFSYYFFLKIEGSGSGSIPLTNGSGSRRPKTYGSDRSESSKLLDSNQSYRPKSCISIWRLETLSRVRIRIAVIYLDLNPQLGFIKGTKYQCCGSRSALGMRIRIQEGKNDPQKKKKEKKFLVFKGCMFFFEGLCFLP